MKKAQLGSSSLKIEFGEQAKEPVRKKLNLTVYDLSYREYIDVDNPLDIERLKAWCHVHWQVTFRSAQLHSNAMEFHICCIAFSRRHFAKTAGHPDHMTLRLNRISSFKAVETEESLFYWLVSIARERARRGERTPFPTINIKHQECQDNELACKPKEDCGTFLKKRCLELDSEVLELRVEVEKAKAENVKLLTSCKEWHKRYSELLAEQEYKENVLATPLKRLSKGEVFLEDS